MKNLLTLFAFMAFFLSVSAQPDTLFRDKRLRFQGQIGFDASGFLKQFVVLNSTTAPTSPINFNAKFLTGWNRFPSLLIGPRLGFGYSNTHSYSNNENQNNERSDDSKSRTARIGLEVQQLISKRWIVYYGVDYINGTSSTSTVSTSSIFNPNPPPSILNVRTEITTNEKTFGYGPVLGLQFNINKWMCLGTETAFYSTQTKGGSKTTSSNPNNTVPETFTDSKTTQFTLPFFVNLNIVF